METSNAKIRLKCPHRPRGCRGQVPDRLERAMHPMSKSRNLRPALETGLALYVSHVGREHWVRFDGISELNDVRRFLFFLQKFGVARRKLRFVSGDSSQQSASREAWEHALKIQIEAHPKGGYFGKTGSISIRPNEPWSRDNCITPAAFRFLMTMA